MSTPIGKREIRFRAWDGKNMIYESLQKEYDDYYMLNLQGEFYPHTRTGDNDFDFDKDPINKIEYCLMQYTGLKDKNGMDVYVGDRIRIYWTSEEDFTDEVITYDEKYCYYKYGDNPICELFDPVTPIEVIGNIYEHPHLLNSQP